MAPRRLKGVAGWRCRISARLRVLLPALCALLFCGQAYAQQATVNVVIEGVNAQLETNVRLFLSMEQQKGHPLLSDGRIRRLNTKSKQEIAAALQPFGYYRPEITSSLTEPKPGEWQARYVIDPGPGIPIAEFNLTIDGEMRDDPELKKMVEEHGLRVDAVFVHPEYEGFKSRLRELAAERGYMQAKFTEARVEIDLEAYLVRVYLGYDSGKRYRFGEISLEQDVLDDDFLQRYITFKQGDPYSLNQLIELKQALNNSNYFQSVEVYPGEPRHDSMEIPVIVKLTPRKNHRYDFGVGYGTDTGARAKVGWRMPRVNRRGHRIDSEVQVSQIGYSVGANYRVPVYNPRTDQLVYTVSQVKENTDSNDSLLRTLGVSLNHNRGEWREILSLNYQSENFEVANDSGTSNLLIPGISWNRTWGPDFINVIDGLRFDIGLRGAEQSIFSDTSFLQLRGGAKFIVSYNPRNRLLLRGNFGATETSGFDRLPSTIRFFAGGSQSVRGYAYESLGPEDSSGDVVGGRYLLTSSVEIEHYFSDNWGAAVFLDTGNAIDSLGDKLEQGAGFGLRWKSPVGPVRIDLANSISRGKNWHLHVSIGPDL
jgi:translocation and assembly module TamA